MGRPSRYLRKVDGTIVCREDGQTITSHAAHVAQWHSLSPRPQPEGMSGDSTPVAVDWSPLLAARGWVSHGPIEVDA